MISFQGLPSKESVGGYPRLDCWIASFNMRKEGNRQGFSFQAHFPHHSINISVCLDFFDRLLPLPFTITWMTLAASQRKKRQQQLLQPRCLHGRSLLHVGTAIVAVPLASSKARVTPGAAAPAMAPHRRPCAATRSPQNRPFHSGLHAHAPLRRKREALTPNTPRAREGGETERQSTPTIIIFLESK